MSKLIRKSTHGGQTISGKTTWICVCGKQEKTESDIDLPLGWCKMVIWRGTNKGTIVNDVIKCIDCQLDYKKKYDNKILISNKNLLK